MDKPMNMADATQLLEALAAFEQEPTELPGFDYGAVEEKHEDVPVVWVSHELIELPCNYDPDNKPTAEQLKAWFVGQTQAVFDTRSLSQGHTEDNDVRWTEVRPQCKAWLAEPTLNDLTITFED